MTETTAGFQRRLLDAVAGHPDVPTKQFGRQRWLIDRLASVADLQVTPNTVHKWFKGQSAPRHDHMRALAKTLSVDEAWLALGTRPLLDVSTGQRMRRDVSASAAVLTGAFQMSGWQAGIPQSKDQVYDLVVIGDAGIVEIELISQVYEGSEVVYHVKEPVQGRKLIELSLNSEDPNGNVSISFTLRDFSNVPRKSFGGYSLISGRFKDDGSFLPHNSETAQHVITFLDSIADKRCNRE